MSSEINLNYAIKIKTIPDDKSRIINCDADKAALQAITAKIIYIGILNCDDTENNVVSFYGEEKTILEEFWKYVGSRSEVINGINAITWNGSSFDIPFIYQRTVINRIAAKTTFASMENLNTFNQNKCASKITDLSKVWSCNRYGYINSLYDVGFACNIIPDIIYKALNSYTYLNFSDDLTSNDDNRKNKALEMVKTELLIIKTLFKLII